VLPVYETDRHDSVVNRIFGRALALVPDVIVVNTAACALTRRCSRAGFTRQVEIIASWLRSCAAFSTEVAQERVRVRDRNFSGPLRELRQVNPQKG